MARHSSTERDAARTAQLAAQILEDGKAQDIVEIDLAGKTTIADRMLIASGTSQRQVSALADRLVRGMKEAGQRAIGIEGLPQADWVLVDLGDVIVHVFRPEVRDMYNLEKMWSAAMPEPMEAHA